MDNLNGYGLSVSHGVDADSDERHLEYLKSPTLTRQRRSEAMRRKDRRDPQLVFFGRAEELESLGRIRRPSRYHGDNR